MILSRVGMDNPQIVNMLRAGYRDGLTPPTRNTEFYLASEDNHLIGMCGVVWHKGHCRFKGDYVRPEFRHRGYWQRMMNLRIQMARDRQCETVTAVCTPVALPLWLDRGAIVVKRFKRFTRVSLEL